MVLAEKEKQQSLCRLPIISIKMAELISKYPNDYLAAYDLPLDTDLTTLSHYPSVEIGKEDFN